MRILFRADGNSKIGLGHVYRCLALAEVLHEQYRCEFVIRTPSPQIKNEMLKYCQFIQEINDDADFISEAHLLGSTLNVDDIIVLDGYNFGSTYQKILKEKGCRLVMIDDLCTEHYYTDIIFNHAGGISLSNYDTEYYSQLFLGPRFAIVRKEFKKLDNRPSEFKKNVLVSLGGADPDNLILQVLKNALNKKSDFNYFVLTGSAYVHTKELDEILQLSEYSNVTHLNALTAEQLSELMKKCSIAICSPSTISYEYLTVGGELYLYQTAENQKGIYSYCINEGLAFSFSEYGNVTSPEVSDSIDKQKKIFDGLSLDRIKKIFHSLDMVLNTSIRKVEPGDLNKTYEWINDPETRNMSFNSSPISFEEHTDWFNKKVQDKNSCYYIFEKDREPFAQIRFDKREDKYLLSYSIDVKQRGKGLASMILAEGLKKVKQDIHQNVLVEGFVKKENIASQLAFEKLKFQKERAEEYKQSFKYSITI